jgi:hypothetical protein
LLVQGWAFIFFESTNRPSIRDTKKNDMEKRLSLIAMTFLLMILIISSCKKTEPESGLSSDIQNLVPDSLLQNIKDMGMPVNEGTTPPNIENIYEASPFILVNSNRAGDYVGSQFADIVMEFYDQNNKELTIKVNYVNGGEQGSGLGSFLSGSGNDFSVFVKVASTYSNDNADLLLIISGTKASGSVKDLYYAIFMLNNYGNPHSYWIENGEGRILYDSDGNSPEVESLYSFVNKTSQGLNNSISRP